MNVLANPYLPDLNPVGQPSICAAMLSLAFAALIGGWGIPLVPSARRLAVGAAPVILLLFLALTEGSPLYRARAFPDADDRSAEVIYLVFGMAFSLENLRLLRLPYRLHGSLLSFAFGSMLLYETVGTLVGWHENRWMAWAAVPVFWLAWLPVILWLNRRIRLRLLQQSGLCIQCGYNLTGNISGICPECGTRILQPIPTVDDQAGDEAEADI